MRTGKTSRVVYTELRPEDLPDPTTWGRYRPHPAPHLFLRHVSNNGILHPVLYEWEGEYKIVYGGTRTWAARTLGMNLPAFINDRTGDHPGEVIETPERVREIIGSDGKFKWFGDHIHLYGFGA